MYFLASITSFPSFDLFDALSIRLHRCSEIYLNSNFQDTASRSPLCLAMARRFHPRLHKETTAAGRSCVFQISRKNRKLIASYRSCLRIELFPAIPFLYFIRYQTWPHYALAGDRSAIYFQPLPRFDALDRRSIGRRSSERSRKIERAILAESKRPSLPSSPGVGALRVDWLAPIFPQWSSMVVCVAGRCKLHRCECSADDDDDGIRPTREASYFRIVTAPRRLRATFLYDSSHHPPSVKHVGNERGKERGRRDPRAPRCRVVARYTRLADNADQETTPTAVSALISDLRRWFARL